MREHEEYRAQFCGRSHLDLAKRALIVEFTADKVYRFTCESLVEISKEHYVHRRGSIKSSILAQNHAADQ